MDISNIIYYTREGDKSRTLSLRELCLREDVELEAVFHAVKDAVDEQDLLERISRICVDKVEPDLSSVLYVRFKVYDVVKDRVNYLKFRRRKEK